MHGGRLITLFSARNYCGGDSNDSALLLAAHDADGALRVRPKSLIHRLARVGECTSMYAHDADGAGLPERDGGERLRAGEREREREREMMGTE